MVNILQFIVILHPATVQQGQKVHTGQAIGKAGINDDGNGEVEFILMKENDYINPEAWLKTLIQQSLLFHTIFIFILKVNPNI